MHVPKRFQSLVVLLPFALLSCEQSSTAPQGRSAPANLSSIDITSFILRDGGEPAGLRLTGDVRMAEEGPAGSGVDNLRYEALPEHESQELATTVLKLRANDQPSRDPGAVQVRPSISSDWQEGFKTTSVTRTDDQGNEIRLETRHFKDGQGLARLPAASLLFRNDSLQAVIEFKREAGKQGLRVIRIGADGQPNGISVIGANTASPPEAGSGLNAFFSRFAASCSGTASRVETIVRALGPTPLHAQEEECIDAEMSMVFAAEAYATMEGAALFACTPWKVPAPQVCLLALGAMGTAAAYLTWTTSQYQDCLYENGPNPPGSPGETRVGHMSPSSGGGSGSLCFAVEWEITYNNGATWSPYKTEIVCG